MTEAFDQSYAAFRARMRAEAQARRKATALRMRRVYTRDTRLPLLRVWCHGPRWRRFFEDEEGFMTRGGAYGWPVYDFTADIRELVCEPIRHDVYAEWADPRERFTPA